MALTSFVRDTVIPSCLVHGIIPPPIPALLFDLAVDDTVRYVQILTTPAGRVRANDAIAAEQIAPSQNIPLYQHHADEYFKRNGEEIDTNKNAISLNMSSKKDKNTVELKRYMCYNS